MSKDKAKLFDKLSTAHGRVTAAELRLQRARDERARLVATYVSSKPERVDWYLHPGELTHAEVIKFAGLTENELHKLMQRYVATARKEAKPKARKRRTSTRKAKQRHVTDPRDIGF